MNQPLRHPAMPPPPMLPDCVPGCAPFQYTGDLSARFSYAPVCIPGTNIIVDPCNPSRGRDERWITTENRVDLSAPVAVAAPPQLFNPIAQAQRGNSTWTTVTSTIIAEGMHGMSVRAVTSTNIRAWSDAVEFALFIGGEVYGDPWIGHKEWPTFGLPISRVALQTKTIAIRARVTPPYWSAGWPPTVTRRTPIRCLITASALMEVYVVAVLKPCAGD